MDLICIPAPHVIRRDSLEDFLENLRVAFCSGRPQVLELVGKRVCNLKFFLGLEVDLMRTRNGAHGTSDFVAVGETELRLDKPKVLWSLSARRARSHKEVPTFEQGAAKSSRETRYLIWLAVHSRVDHVRIFNDLYEKSMRAQLHLIPIPERFHCHHHPFENGR